MSVLVVGLSHRSAPVELLERAAVGVDEIPKLLDEMLRGSHVTEVMMLSTCNRIEVYAVVDAFHGGLADVSGVLGRHAGLPLPELTEHLYVHYAGSAVQHLFAVAAGLDSMVIGEAQILGQLRAAYAAADTAGTVGPHPARAVAAGAARRQAGARPHRHRRRGRLGRLRGARRRRRTRWAVRLDGVRAVDRRRRGDGRARRRPPAPRRSRRDRRAQPLAPSGRSGSSDNTRRTGTAARSAPLEALADELATADLLVACTGAVGTVVARETVAAAVAARDGRPLAVCDLGLPRDVDPGVAALPGVTVVDLVALQARLAPRAHGEAVAAAQELVAEEAQAYLAAQRSAEVTPTVTALRRRASEVIDAELLRLDARLPALDPAVREEFARTVRRVVDKLLHTPTVQVKRLAEGPDGSSYAHALRELFELDPQTPAAVAVQRHGDVLAALEAPMQAVREISDPGDSHLRSLREALGRTPVTAPARPVPLRLGTRPSALAVAQSELVAQRLRDAGPHRRAGHRQHLRRPLVGPDRHARRRCVRLAAARRARGRRGRPRRALLQGPPDGTGPAARASPRSRRGKTPATRWSPGTAGCSGSCPRERRSAPDRRGAIAQLEALGLGLRTVPIRGNVDTRIAQGPQRRARRRGRRRGRVAPARPHRRGERAARPPADAPAPAQGALAVECRAADTALAALLAQVLDDAGTRAAVTAERAVLATLEAGCSAPVGALADVVSDLTDDGRVVDRVFLRAVVGTGDGALLRASATGDLDDAEKLGAALAAELLDMAVAVTDPATTRPPALRAGRPPRARSGARRRRRRPGSTGRPSVHAQSGVDR